MWEGVLYVLWIFNSHVLIQLIQSCACSWTRTCGPSSLECCVHLLGHTHSTGLCKGWGAAREENWHRDQLLQHGIIMWGYGGSITDLMSFRTGDYYFITQVSHWEPSTWCSTTFVCVFVLVLNYWQMSYLAFPFLRRVSIYDHILSNFEMYSEQYPFFFRTGREHQCWTLSFQSSMIDLHRMVQFFIIGYSIKCFDTIIFWFFNCTVGCVSLFIFIGVG